jgi:hypothetical protein
MPTELLLIAAAWLLACVVFVGFWVAVFRVSTWRAVRRRERAQALARARRLHGWPEAGRRR